MSSKDDSAAPDAPDRPVGGLQNARAYSGNVRHSSTDNPSLLSVLARPRAATPFADAVRDLLDAQSAASILVDQDYNIVHVAPRADRFLIRMSGTPTLHLLLLIHPDLRLDLRAVLFKAIRAGGSVDVRHRGFALDDWAVNVTITARPVSLLGEKHILVTLDAVEISLTSETGADVADHAILVQLEAENAELRDLLKETIDAAEAFTEGLTFAKEEAQSLSEEFRAAKEELEASKEEVESINTELITVNGELTLMISEAGRINEDLRSLIASSEVATIFVDGDRRIRRFTPKALEIFNLIQADVGRALSDISHHLHWDGLHGRLIAVLASGLAEEQEVLHENGRLFMARVAVADAQKQLTETEVPRRLRGAILTFVDITGLRDAHRRLEESERRFSLMADGPG